MLWVWFALLAAFGYNTSVSADLPEHDVKAAYIARFTEFIEWPESQAVEQIKPTFDICVFGDHPIEMSLAKLPSLITVKKRRIDVRRISVANAAASCDILFLPASQNDELPQIKTVAHGKPVLVINEIPSAVYRGQIVSLYSNQGRMRFDLHLDQAQGVGFKISSRLLKLANIVAEAP